MTKDVCPLDYNEMEQCGYSKFYKYSATNSDIILSINADKYEQNYWDMVHPPPPFELSMTCTVVVENRYIYVLGGYNCCDSFPFQRNDVFIYDEQEQQWGKSPQTLPETLIVITSRH